LVVGPERKFVGALIVPAMNAVKDWMKQNNIVFTTKEEAVKNEKVVALFHSIVEEYNKLFNHVEQVKKFELLPNEWGIDTGEMTPKMSLKRKVITEKYKESIERIYTDC